MCSDTFWKGYCTSVVGPCGQCITIPAAYQGDMSSFGPGNGCFCTLLECVDISPLSFLRFTKTLSDHMSANARSFHSNDSCINLSRGITYLHPGQADMTKDNWDNRAKSYICFQSTNKSV